MTVYHFKANSVAAPFFSDPSDGFIEEATAMKALEKLVREYTHPCGLFSAVIESCEPKPKMLARYLSASAVAQQTAVDDGGSILGANDKYQSKHLVKNKTGEYDEVVQTFYVKDYKEKYENFEVFE
jgi:hypothetical protein